MTGEIIKSFLVGLGFEVDEAGLKKFNRAIATAALRVTALYASVKASTGAIVYGISQVSDSFEKLGYEYRLIAPALSRTLALRRELLKAYAAAGVNLTQVIQNAVRLNFSLTKTRYAFQALYQGVASRFFPLLTRQSDQLRQKIYANMGRIQNFLERGIKFIFKAFEATVTLGERLWSILGRVYDFLVKLHQATDGWSTAILAVGAAWKLLNLSFLATPLGMIIGGLTALLALYDDFQTYKEGGQSLFNWGPAIPTIDAVTAALHKTWDVLIAIKDAAVWVGEAIQRIQYGKGISLPKVDFSGAGTGFLEGAKNFLGNAASQIVNPFGGGAKLGVGGVNNGASNQHVQQQTQINVSSTADASSVGKSIAGEQSRVNFDLVRNLRGATR